jgi:Arc/MetJ-type ribon-helix-helix transcriptional regulator
MTIQLPENIERSIVEAVRNGRFPSVDDALTAAWLAFNDPAKSVANLQALTLDELHRQMLHDGLLARLPDIAEDLDDDDEEPEVIDGEPLSETVIRERS